MNDIPGPNGAPAAWTAYQTAFQNLIQSFVPGQTGNVAADMGFTAGGAQTPPESIALPKKNTLKPIDLYTPVNYNVGAVTEAYFGSNPKFLDLINSTSNKPSSITSPAELFSAKRGTNKGMITTWIPSNSATSFDSTVPSGSLAQGPSSDMQSDRYGFQFHYNPTSIAMTYGGGPDTDVNFEITGGDKFNYIGTANGANIGQSTIAFNIPINRVGDMRWYNTATRSLTSDAPSDLYAPRMPSEIEQVAICTKGTMYDVEALLAALLGYKMKTKFRDMTADLGWTSGRPVELYLGKGLRYLGFIGSMSVNHVLFDERMVPTFSIVSLAFNRIPDYNGI